MFSKKDIEPEKGYFSGGAKRPYKLGKEELGAEGKKRRTEFRGKGGRLRLLKGAKGKGWPRRKSPCRNLKAEEGEEERGGSPKYCRGQPSSQWDVNSAGKKRKYRTTTRGVKGKRIS